MGWFDKKIGSGKSDLYGAGVISFFLGEAVSPMLLNPHRDSAKRGRYRHEKKHRREKKNTANFQWETHSSPLTFLISTLLSLFSSLHTP
ncbi:hypothetical protein Lalb_Chr02g0154171 [Lupinus albus]|uniref:Uncharacterized protein n=1 Tax=Lupinus albus TaxID=3870 RepID=A0A6A4QYP8_LUPAL|nr:hypothetical protein Lalb_Chr02g0154171 [Lupinus albus]